MDEVTLAVRLRAIEGRLKTIELTGQESHKVLELLVSRVNAQNHRLDKVEWKQQQEAIVEERMWSNVRWTIATVFMSAGVASGIFFGLINTFGQ